MSVTVGPELIFLSLKLPQNFLNFFNFSFYHAGFSVMSIPYIPLVHAFHNALGDFSSEASAPRSDIVKLIQEWLPNAYHTFAEIYKQEARGTYGSKLSN